MVNRSSEEGQRGQSALPTSAATPSRPRAELARRAAVVGCSWVPTQGEGRRRRSPRLNQPPSPSRTSSSGGWVKPASIVGKLTARDRLPATLMSAPKSKTSFFPCRVEVGGDTPGEGSSAAIDVWLHPGGHMRVTLLKFTAPLEQFSRARVGFATHRTASLENTDVALACFNFYRSASRIRGPERSGGSALEIGWRHPQNGCR